MFKSYKESKNWNPNVIFNAIFNVESISHFLNVLDYVYIFNIACLALEYTTKHG